MDQVIQVLGSVLILVPFVAAARCSVKFIALIPVDEPHGSGILTVIVAVQPQYGFLLSCPLSADKDRSR